MCIVYTCLRTNIYPYLYIYITYVKTTRGTESDGLSFQIKQLGRIVGKNDKGKGQLTAGRKKVYILAIGSSWNSCKRKQISWPSGIFWPGHVQLTHLDMDALTIPEFATLGAAENWFTQSCLHTGSGSILRNGTGHIWALGFHSLKHPPLGIVASIAFTYGHVPCTNKIRTCQCEVEKLLKCMMFGNKSLQEIL